MDDHLKLNALLKEFHGIIDKYSLSAVADSAVAEEEWVVPDRLKELNRFFYGKLTPGDVSRLPSGMVTYNTIFIDAKREFTFLADAHLVLLWQWSPEAPVSHLYMPPPVLRTSMVNLMPRGYVAKRAALISVVGNNTSIYLINVLTGIISPNDPIHTEIKKHKR